MGCLQFDDPETAFRYLLDKKPAILAVGEAHAQKGKEGTASAAKRFTDSLLPFCKGRASDLVLELMAPNDRCAKKTEAVRTKQREVTKHQAASNQSEYVLMGERARALGIVPDLLRPSCDDLAAIQKAGDGSVALTLETIARLTRDKAGQLVDRNAKTPADADKTVLTYGGILHNDLEPSKERAAWSFGPALAEHVKQRYIELDLFVPEFIEDTDIWRRLPWYSHYDKVKLGEKTTLFQVGENSYAIVFPLSE